ncbi:MAG: hypothetical protein CV087_19040 [Candidatus Brocadia sp. WS118]|nr:MAG: hypothetical protein CV087_19040 [Candidatus Brocadia sp. WS118]
MAISEIFKIAAAVITALGGGSAIVLALSSWIGKVWANRLMVQDRAKYEQALAKLQAELRHDSERELTNIKNDLDIFKEKHLRGHSDKIAIYRLAVDIIAEKLGDLDYISLTKQMPPDALQKYDKFNRARIKAYGYLAMLAPQNVMDALDALFDHLILIAQGKEQYECGKSTRS